MTEQAEFWASSFGDEYISRNDSSALLASNLYLFGQILSACESKPKSFLEFGANVGMNFKAISQLCPGSDFLGVEVNKKAFEQLIGIGARAVNDTIENFKTPEKFDFVFTKGVLIHLDPESLADTYKKMASSSSKYVMICEYFNPTPVSVDYRGHKNRLFKRDFGAEFLDANKEFDQVAEGFVSRRNIFSQDDLTWFLFKRA